MNTTIKRTLFHSTLLAFRLFTSVCAWNSKILSMNSYSTFLKRDTCSTTTWLHTDQPKPTTHLKTQKIKMTHWKIHKHGNGYINHDLDSDSYLNILMNYLLNFSKNSCVKSLWFLLQLRLKPPAPPKKKKGQRQLQTNHIPHGFSRLFQRSTLAKDQARPERSGSVALVAMWKRWWVKPKLPSSRNPKKPGKKKKKTMKPTFRWVLWYSNLTMAILYIAPKEKRKKRSMDTCWLNMVNPIRFSCQNKKSVEQYHGQFPLSQSLSSTPCLCIFLKCSMGMAWWSLPRRVNHIPPSRSVDIEGWQVPNLNRWSTRNCCTPGTLFCMCFFRMKHLKSGTNSHKYLHILDACSSSIIIQ